MPLTSFQSAAWELDLATEGVGSALWRAFLLPADVDRERLAAACRAVIDNYAVLRLRDGGHGEPLPDARAAEGPYPVSVAADAGEPLLESLAASPIRLADGPLRLHLIDVAGQERPILAVGVHHAAIDFLSLILLLRSLGDAYQGLPLPPVAPLVRREVRPPDPGDLRYWREELSGAPATLELAWDALPEPAHHHPVATSARALASDASDAIDSLAAAQAVTPFVIQLAAIASVLVRRSSGHECMIGIPYHNRFGNRAHRAAVPDAAVLPLRARIPHGSGFADAVRAVAAGLREAVRHRGVAPQDLVRLCGIERVPGRMPLLQVLLTGYGHADAAAVAMASGSVRCGPLELDLLPLREHYGAFDLSFAVGTVGGARRLELTYAADRLQPRSADSLLDAVERLLAAAASSPDSRLDALDPVAAAPAPAGLRRLSGAAPTPDSGDPIAPELVRLWEELLGPGSAAGDADFFTCGGDSLLAARLLARVRQDLAVTVTVGDFLLQPDLRSLSRRVSLLRWARPSPRSPGEVEGDI